MGAINGCVAPSERGSASSTPSFKSIRTTAREVDSYSALLLVAKGLRGACESREARPEHGVHVLVKIK